MRLAFDTSVWVDHLRLNALAPILPVIRGRFLLGLDAVVHAELIAGCKSKRERRVVDRLLEPFSTRGRLLVPVHGDFERAAGALSRLRQRGVVLSSPGAALLDALIASIAVSGGSLLVTKNEGDFAKLGSELPLHFETFDAFRSRVAGTGMPGKPT